MQLQARQATKLNRIEKIKHTSPVSKQVINVKIIWYYTLNVVMVLHDTSTIMVLK